MGLRNDQGLEAYRRTCMAHCAAPGRTAQALAAAIVATATLMLTVSSDLATCAPTLHPVHGIACAEVEQLQSRIYYRPRRLRWLRLRGTISAPVCFAWARAALPTASVMRLAGGGADRPWEKAKTMPDYYAELGVALDVTDRDLKRAHKKMMLKYHPDKNAGSKLAQDRFLRVQEAYTVLSQPLARREYDHARRGPSVTRNPAPPRPSSTAAHGSARPRPKTEAPPRQKANAMRGETWRTHSMPDAAPSAWAQQRSQEAAWEYGGEMGAAMARTLRRHEKLRREAAERARAALRQDKLDDTACPSAAADTSPPSFASGFGAGSGRPGPGSAGDRDASKGHALDKEGVDGVRAGGTHFDWRKMESVMPFLSELREHGAGAGIPLVRRPKPAVCCTIGCCVLHERLRLVVLACSQRRGVL